MSHLPDRIAFITDARAWGGAEVYLTQLAAGVKAAGIEPHIFCADRREVDAWVAELVRIGFRVERYRPTKEFDPAGVSVARPLVAGFDLVHVNKTHPRNSLPAIAAARLAGVRAIVTTEHLALPPDSHFPAGRRIITSLVRWSNRFVDRTIAVSELSRDMLIRNYEIPPDRIVAIRNGIDVGRFEGPFDRGATRTGLGLGSGDRVALLIGRFAARKGHDYALRAVAAVLSREPGFKLVFAGDGELEHDLRHLARDLGAEDSVVFAGFRRDVPELLAASDLLILPSEDECLPLVILEAMSSRLPVVSTDVGGISEAVVDGVTGLLVSPRDAQGLADAIVSVLSDPERAAALGRAGRARVEAEFSLQASAAQVFKVYEDVLAGKGSGT